MTPKQRHILRTAPLPESGNRIALALELKRCTAMDVVRATGFTPQYVSDIRSGRYRNLSLDNAHKFASFFGCAIEDLFPAREAVA